MSLARAISDASDADVLALVRFLQKEFGMTAVEFGTGNSALAEEHEIATAIFSWAFMTQSKTAEEE